MPETDEKLIDIAAEMRAYADRLDDAGGAPSPTDLRKFADRIERAANNLESSFGMALSIEEGLRKRDRGESERRFTDAKYEIKGLVDISEHLLEYIGRVSMARAAGEEPSDDDMEALTGGITTMRERMAHAERKFLQEDGGAK